MGTIPESIPYEKFLELQSEVHEVRCSLSLVLRIISGLAGFSDDQITAELYKEITKERSDMSVEVLLPNVANTFVDSLPIANKYCRSSVKSSEVDPLRTSSSDIELPIKSFQSENVSNCIAKTKNQCDIKSVVSNDDLEDPLKPNLSENITKRKIRSDDRPATPKKKPFVVPVDISTLLPRTSSLTNSVDNICSSTSNLSEKVECVETNNVSNRLKSSKITSETVIKVPTEVAIVKNEVELVESNPEMLTEDSNTTNKTLPPLSCNRLLSVPIKIEQLVKPEVAIPKQVQLMDGCQTTTENSLDRSSRSVRDKCLQMIKTMIAYDEERPVSLTPLDGKYISCYNPCEKRNTRPNSTYKDERLKLIHRRCREKKKLKEGEIQLYCTKLERVNTKLKTKAKKLENAKNYIVRLFAEKAEPPPLIWSVAAPTE